MPMRLNLFARAANRDPAPEAVRLQENAIVWKDRCLPLSGVFSAAGIQDVVFEEVAFPHLRNALSNKQNVTFLFYGAAGSGKSYTMDGGWLCSEENLEDHGMVPRTMHYMFATRKDHVEASFVEFNDGVMRDLLSTHDGVPKVTTSTTTGVGSHGVPTTSPHNPAPRTSSIDNAIRIKCDQGLQKLREAYAYGTSRRSGHAASCFQIATFDRNGQKTLIRFIELRSADPTLQSPAAFQLQQNVKILSECLQSALKPSGVPAGYSQRSYLTSLLHPTFSGTASLIVTFCLRLDRDSEMQTAYPLLQLLSEHALLTGCGALRRNQDSEDYIRTSSIPHQRYVHAREVGVLDDNILRDLEQHQLEAQHTHSAQQPLLQSGQKELSEATGEESRFNVDAVVNAMISSCAAVSSDTSDKASSFKTGVTASTATSGLLEETGGSSSSCFSEGPIRGDHHHSTSLSQHASRESSKKSVAVAPASALGSYTVGGSSSSTAQWPPSRESQKVDDPATSTKIMERPKNGGSCIEGGINSAASLPGEEESVSLSELPQHAFMDCERYWESSAKLLDLLHSRDIPTHERAIQEILRSLYQLEEHRALTHAGRVHGPDERETSLKMLLEKVTLSAVLGQAMQFQYAECLEFLRIFVKGQAAAKPKPRFAAAPTAVRCALETLRKVAQKEMGEVGYCCIGRPDDAPAPETGGGDDTTSTGSGSAIASATNSSKGSVGSALLGNFRGASSKNSVKSSQSGIDGVSAIPRLELEKLPPPVPGEQDRPCYIVNPHSLDVDDDDDESGGQHADGSASDFGLASAPGGGPTPSAVGAASSFGKADNRYAPSERNSSKLSCSSFGLLQSREEISQSSPTDPHYALAANARSREQFVDDYSCTSEDLDEFLGGKSRVSCGGACATSGQNLGLSLGHTKQGNNSKRAGQGALAHKSSAAPPRVGPGTTGQSGPSGKLGRQEAARASSAAPGAVSPSSALLPAERTLAHTQSYSRLGGPMPSGALRGTSISAGSTTLNNRGSASGGLDQPTKSASASAGTRSVLTGTSSAALLTRSPLYPGNPAQNRRLSPTPLPAGLFFSGAGSTVSGASSVGSGVGAARGSSVAVSKCGRRTAPTSRFGGPLGVTGTTGGASPQHPASALQQWRKTHFAGARGGALAAASDPSSVASSNRSSLAQARYPTRKGSSSASAGGSVPCGSVDPSAGSTAAESVASSGGAVAAGVTVHEDQNVVPDATDPVLSQPASAAGVAVSMHQHAPSPVAGGTNIVGLASGAMSVLGPPPQGLYRPHSRGPATGGTSTTANQHGGILGAWPLVRAVSPSPIRVSTPFQPIQQRQAISEKKESPQDFVGGAVSGTSPHEHDNQTISGAAVENIKNDEQANARSVGHPVRFGVGIKKYNAPPPRIFATGLTSKLQLGTTQQDTSATGLAGAATDNKLPSMRKSQSVSTLGGVRRVPGARGPSPHWFKATSPLQLSQIRSSSVLQTRLQS
ncbi:unnamed protein product [Amoebophrya sp. A25]|nr:unnamed protein product [Amoebophrya sp. A25]|eukprot:GSA25T00005894001.1